MTTVRVISSVVLACWLPACSFLTPLPEPSSLEDRLSAIPTNGLPLKGRTVIYWDKHQIPFIETDHDEDAAMARTWS